MADLLAFQGGCPCCFPTVLLFVLLAPCLIFYSLERIIECLFPSFKTGAKIFSFLTRIVSFLVLVSAVGLGMAASKPEWKSYLCYSFITKIANKHPNPLDQHRCGLVSGISGRVLEIGPGPGTNFWCWGSESNSTHDITEWVGVEPNEFFQLKIEENRLAHGLTFPTSTVWLKGEHVDVEPESFDAVVGTHVLCSVDDVYQVLRQVKRALKPGGTYYFMEHVAAPPGSLLHISQFLLEPFFNIVGNGCRFRTLWRELSNDLSAGGGLEGFDVQLQHLDAPIPLPPLIPHVIGTATKF